MNTYNVWRSNHNSPNEWFQTTYTVTGRTDKEARSRVRRKFKDFGFSSMSLLAVIVGETP